MLQLANARLRAGGVPRNAPLWRCEKEATEEESR
jgi:hypothetical protein